jgi:hypothetical protein
MAQKYCSATKKDGGPCRSWACSGSDYCFVHDPAQAKERNIARRKGGKARHGRVLGEIAEPPEPVRLQTIADVLDLLERTANDVLRLENSLSRARTITALCGVVIKAIQDGELEDRVNEILATLKGRQ